MQDNILNKVVNSLGAELANRYISESVLKARMEQEVEAIMRELEQYKTVLHSDDTLLALYHEQKEKLESEQHDVQDK